ncbi:3'(2'),5'-bisphosphate nucleotidase CysQ [Micromonospora sp. KC606]|uniref:3'(2'),5'-bisphosphate nucleotidase CysQ n=1 Tax=Micromonospora sp. KC606 TaxID=2530379 RepID=UPI001044858E|nr:3'(2'),5'-bisphosphate nucleotidase CysQ [Micromonospora sp. KC606]TDC81652.1 3'(2'),5'-bisphosphate nucleotidase CysQ [Micromonospora sp. KC606]
MIYLSTAPDDCAFSGLLAAQTGELLMRLRDEMGFADPKALRASGDRQAHEFLLTELARWRPGDAVLSEEGEHRGDDRATADRVWIVDPLDGTREYAEAGRTDWAVHVALWEHGVLTAGAVALPALGEVLTSRQRPAPPIGRDPVRIVVSRTRPPSFLGDVAAAVGGELVPMGSAGAKVAAVVRGAADAYIHAGGQHEWDSAAPVAVAAAAGLHASRVDGSPLVYNQPDPKMPDLLVCRADLSERLLAAIASATAGAAEPGQQAPKEPIR